MTKIKIEVTVDDEDVYKQFPTYPYFVPYMPSTTTPAFPGYGNQFTVICEGL